MMTPIGRITLVNAVLSSIPIYLLVAINAPKWVIKGIDKIRRGFLWAERQLQMVALVGSRGREFVRPRTMAA